MITIISGSREFRSVRHATVAEKLGRAFRQAAFISSVALGAGCQVGIMTVKTPEPATQEKKPVYQAAGSSDKGTAPDNNTYVPALDINNQPEILMFLKVSSRYDSGKVQIATWFADTAFQGIIYKDRTNVDFYENGRVFCGIPAADVTVEGVTDKAGKPISFFRNGKIEKGVLAADISIQGINYKAGTLMIFHQSGKVRLGTLVDASIDGVAYKSGTDLGFDENGRINWVKLSGDTPIKGTTYPAGTQIGFDGNGRIKSLYVPAQTIDQTASPYRFSQ